MSEKDAEELRYGMLGEDSSSLGEKLDKYSGQVGWDYLRPHYESDSLFWVDPSIELLAVGNALADDDASLVKAWLSQGDVVRVGELHAAQWEGGEEVFLALVVSPFVLMQSMADSTAENE